ncbi:hypothetical protein BDN70DRAFT_875644 [Pholiota conissans]|uniref:Uncharacterized protein n=1 Tax=Pholiota conissans TaxID=109636 RepID=A0A9P5Z7F2_9AGAR|nr:hypothetical protein BDN70DRAFT_875644 [Pholiota conissans]
MRFASATAFLFSVLSFVIAAPVPINDDVTVGNVARSAGLPPPWRREASPKAAAEPSSDWRREAEPLSDWRREASSDWRREAQGAPTRDW